MPEQVKLALEAIGLEEQGAAVGLGVMALFGKGAPLLTLLRRAQDRLRAGAIALRDAPMGLLSANGV